MHGVRVGLLPAPATPFTIELHSPNAPSHGSVEASAFTRNNKTVPPFVSWGALSYLLLTTTGSHADPVLLGGLDALEEQP